jgi:hypothetical protein
MVALPLDPINCRDTERRAALLNLQSYIFSYVAIPRSSLRVVGIETYTSTYYPTVAIFART